MPSNSSIPAKPALPIESAQASFLILLPIIVSIARLHFRHLRCSHRQEDCVHEAVALAWKWHCRLVERGRSAADFIVTFARLAARAVNSGRRLCGQEPIRDVMSRVCQHKHHFFVSPLPDGHSKFGTTIEDALAENTQSPVPVQVQFRSDFPAWTQRLSPRTRQAVEQLALGHQTQDVAKRFGVSSARISQMRSELHKDYMHFLHESSGG
jgi:DNA-directed RNA polymerase specialized sigma24 family protein